MFAESEFATRTLVLPRNEPLFLDSARLASTLALDERHGRERGVGHVRSTPLPGTELRRAMAEPKPFLWNRTALLAAPLLSMEGGLGVITVEAGAQAGPHANWLSAVAVLASPVSENLRRLEWIEVENRRLIEEMNVRHNVVREGPG